MDFAPSYNPETESFRKEVVAWLKENAPTIVGNPDEDENYAKHRRFGEALGAKGWLFPTYPKQYGGGGLSFEHSVVIAEEVQRLGFGIPPFYNSAATLGGPSILVWGTEEQKQKWCVPMFRGEMMGWIALTGPEAGSDLAGTHTDAIRDGDEYVINGTKIFIGGSHTPDILWTFTRTDPKGARHKNASWFVIPTNLPGVTIRPMDMLADGGEGVGATQKNTIYFENVRVPASYLVGGENHGWAVANTHLELEHGGGGSIATETWFHKTIAFAKEYQKGGQPLVKDADARDLLADIYVSTEATRLFQLRNYWMNRTHQPMSYEGSQSSYRGKLAGLDVAEWQQDLLGPASLVSGGAIDPEGTIEHHHRAAITALHPGGTADIQKVIIARRLGVGRDEAEEAGRTPD